MNELLETFHVLHFVTLISFWRDMELLSFVSTAFPERDGPLSWNICTVWRDGLKLNQLKQ